MACVVSVQRTIFHPHLLFSFPAAVAGVVFLRNRTEADDVFDGIGYAHVEFGEFSSALKSGSGGRIGRGWDRR